MYRIVVVSLSLTTLAGCFFYRPAMKLNGFVSNARTRQPIGGARVRVGDLVTYAEGSGAYLLKVHRGSSATAEVSAPGYETKMVTCDAPNRRPVCDVALTPVAR